MSDKTFTFGTETWGHGTEKCRIGTEIGEGFWCGGLGFRSQEAVFWPGSAENFVQTQDSCPSTVYRPPSAFDHRPLRLDELEDRFKHIVYVSSTPSPYEREKADGQTVAMVIRPTCILDPVIDLRLSQDCPADLLRRLADEFAVGEQALIMVKTIKQAEEVAGQLAEEGIRIKAVHSELKPAAQESRLKDLRVGDLDVLVGIGMLREGLDLPKVSLVAILDADKKGLHRGTTDLLQMIGRATRNVKGQVVFYASTVTKAMLLAIIETRQRRRMQEDFNRQNGMRPGAAIAAS